MFVSRTLLPKLPFILFFLVVLGISFYTVGDYGISVDEPTQHRHLKITGRKIMETFGLMEYAPETIAEAEKSEI